LETRARFRKPRGGSGNILARGHFARPPS
jgi:hypothetical protein